MLKFDKYEKWTILYVQDDLYYSYLSNFYIDVSMF